MVTVAGVDEAGRGPVLGPMVFAGVKIKKKELERLRDLGVKDSKDLSKEKREELFEKIKEMVEDYCIIALPPKRIDDAVSSATSSLNALGSDVSANILSILSPASAVLDCPSTNIAAYKQEMEHKLRAYGLDGVHGSKLVVEHKADTNHVIVGAASILAKVTRDRLIKELENEVGVPVGSGYPSDPVTKQFLKEYWNTHDVFRKSWATWKKIAENSKQRSLGDF